MWLTHCRASPRALEVCHDFVWNFLPALLATAYTETYNSKSKCGNQVVIISLHNCDNNLVGPVAEEFEQLVGHQSLVGLGG